MKVISFSDMINHDVFFHNIIAMHQSGKNMDEFHYIQTPRPNSGLILARTPGLIYSLPDETKIIVQKGDILYLPEGSYYSVKFENTETKTILVNFNLKDSNLNPIIASENICSYSTKNKYENMFLEICDIYTDKVENKLLLNSMLYNLFNTLATQKEKKSQISFAIDYINNHLTQNFSIHELSKYSAMSESTFRREFKKETGTSPLKYITNEKLKKAAQLLLFSDLSINEIAFNFGFFDTSHFYKTFKEFYHKTPSQYKKEYHNSVSYF